MIAAWFLVITVVSSTDTAMIQVPQFSQAVCERIAAQYNTGKPVSIRTGTGGFNTVGYRATCMPSGYQTPVAVQTR